MIDTLVDIVVILVAVFAGSSIDVVQTDIVRAAVVLVFGKVGIREQRRRQMLKPWIVGINDAATTRRKISLLGEIRPFGRCQFVGRRILPRRVTPCKVSRSLNIDVYKRVFARLLTDSSSRSLSSTSNRPAVGRRRLVRF